MKYTIRIERVVTDHAEVVIEALNINLAEDIADEITSRLSDGCHETVVLSQEVLEEYTKACSVEWDLYGEDYTVEEISEGDLLS